MTTASVLAQVKLLLAKGQSFGLQDTQFYAYMNYVVRELEDKTLCTMRQNIPILTTSGEGTYDLSDTDIITPTSSCSFKKIRRLWGENTTKKVRESDLATISRLRLSNTGGGIPILFSQTIVADDLILDVFPNSMVTTDADSVNLFCNIIEKTPTVSAIQNPLLPESTFDALATGTVAKVYQFVARQRTSVFADEYEKQIRSLRDYYNKMSTGEAISGVST